MARGLNRLTALAIKAAQSAGWYGDGGGLYLEVDTKGGRRWMLRLVVGGRRGDLGLGGLHKVSATFCSAPALQTEPRLKRC